MLVSLEQLHGILGICMKVGGGKHLSKDVSDQKWAIMVELAPDDFIFITEDTGHCWDLRVKLWDDLDKALEHSKQWKSAVVIPYED